MVEKPNKFSDLVLVFLTYCCQALIRREKGIASLLDSSIVQPAANSDNGLFNCTTCGGGLQHMSQAWHLGTARLEVAFNTGSRLSSPVVF